MANCYPLIPQAARLKPGSKLRAGRLDPCQQGAIVLNGSSGQALAFGPGHVKRTPDAGESGTAVYAAHRDTHFAFIGDVRIEIRVTRRDGAVFR
jgi:hypothetical protein